MEGKKYLKFSGIILIIMGAADLLLACFALAGGGLAAFTGNVSGDSAMSLTGTTAVIGGIMFMVIAVFNLIFGIMAVRNCDKPEKAGALRVMGVILLILAVVSLVIYISGGLTVVIGCIVDLIVSILYFWGAQKNLKSLN